MTYNLKSIKVKYDLGKPLYHGHQYAKKLSIFVCEFVSFKINYILEIIKNIGHIS